MSIGNSVKVSRGFAIGGISVTIPQGTLVADTIELYRGTIDKSTTSLHRVFNSGPVGQIAFVGIYATKALTINTNSAGAPDQQFTLGADGNVIWIKTDLSTNPVTDEITDLYITNASSTESADLTFVVLKDQPGVGS